MRFSDRVLFMTIVWITITLYPLAPTFNWGSFSRFVKTSQIKTFDCFLIISGFAFLTATAESRPISNRSVFVHQNSHAIFTVCRLNEFRFFFSLKSMWYRLAVGLVNSKLIRGNYNNKSYLLSHHGNTFALYHPLAISSSHAWSLPEITNDLWSHSCV